MISDALNIGASSLKAQQKALDVVSHNIANANTPGYSRQAANLTTMQPDRIGNLVFGRGVDVQSIQRNVNALVDSALAQNGAQLSHWDTVTTNLQTIENIFGSLTNTGLSAALDDFFLSWQQLANNPQDLAQQMNVITKSTTLTSQLNAFQQQLATAQTTADGQVDQEITKANLLLDQIASLNAQINRQESNSQMGAANDLRDQRDQTMRDLMGILPVQQVITQDGSLMLQSANGDLLVQGDTSRHLARGSASGTGFPGVVIAETGSALSLTQGGTLGGLTSYRDDYLGNYMSQINSLAANLAFGVNQLHASGASVSHLTSAQSSLSTDPALALDDPAQMTPYAGQIVSGSFTVHTYDATGAPTPAGGTTINVTAGTTTMNDIVNSLNGIAGLSASIDATGKLSIQATGSGSFAFGGDTSNVLAAYELNSFFSGSDAGSIAVDANVLATSTINTGTVDPATSLVQSGDNTTAMAIYGLQDVALSFDGTAADSLHTRASVLSTTYGNDVAAADQQRQYRQSEADSLNSQRQSISGVNTDEELVSMLKFQRAYEAAAKVITTANTMLDSLIGLIR